jgi:hypothetical protein
MPVTLPVKIGIFFLNPDDCNIVEGPINLSLLNIAFGGNLPRI